MKAHATTRGYKYALKSLVFFYLLFCTPLYIVFLSTIKKPRRSRAGLYAGWNHNNRPRSLISMLRNRAFR